MLHCRVKIRNVNKRKFLLDWKTCLFILAIYYYILLFTLFTGTVRLYFCVFFLQALEAVLEDAPFSGRRLSLRTLPSCSHMPLELPGHNMSKMTCFVFKKLKNNVSNIMFTLIPMILLHEKMIYS